jgi:hypothetical protein
MKSQVIKRSVVIDGHKTSISLEDAFWSSLKAIAQAKVRRWRRRLQRSTKHASRAIYPPRSVYSYSTASAMDKRVSSTSRSGRTPPEGNRPP